MASSSRTPPRFVPTLTAVVEIPPELPTVNTPAAAATASTSTPPIAGDSDSSAAAASGNMIEDLGFGPPPVAARAPLPATLSAGTAGATAMVVSEEDAFRLEEQLLHRVLQRVDLSLEERLTDSVSAAVQRQLDAMLPRLRSEIEGVLRALVVEALAQELSETPGSAPPFRPSTFG